MQRKNDEVCGRNECLGWQREKKLNFGLHGILPKDIAPELFEEVRKDELYDQGTREQHLDQ
jgi:hypothetical protein